MYHVCGANAELDKAYNSISINFFSNIYYPPIKGWNSLKALCTKVYPQNGQVKWFHVQLSKDVIINYWSVLSLKCQNCQWSKQKFSILFKRNFIPPSNTCQVLTKPLQVMVKFNTSVMLKSCRSLAKAVASH